MESFYPIGPVQVKCFAVSLIHLKRNLIESLLCFFMLLKNLSSADGSFAFILRRNTTEKIYFVMRTLI